MKTNVAFLTFFVLLPTLASAEISQLPTPLGLKTGMSVDEVKTILTSKKATLELGDESMERSPMDTMFPVQKIKATLPDGPALSLKGYFIKGKLARWRVLARPGSTSPVDLTALGAPSRAHKGSHFWWNAKKLIGVRCSGKIEAKTYDKCEARDYSVMVGVVGTRPQVEQLFLKLIGPPRK